MRAWRLERLGGSLELKDVPVPEPHTPNRKKRRAAKSVLLEVD